MLDQVGRATQDFFEYAGGLTLLSAESAGFMVRLRIRVGETISQCYLLGVQSLIIVLLTSLFTGMVISLESAQQAVQYGVGSLVGSAVAYASVRELGPMLTAVVVAGRVGAAIAAELGSMVVTEQIEALRSMGLEPSRFLVVPRLLALLIMLPLLTIFADVISIAGGCGSPRLTRTSRPKRFFRRRVRRSASKTCSKAPEIGRIRLHHCDGRCLPRADDARRSCRRRTIDDRLRRARDHSHLHLEFRALVLALRREVACDANSSPSSTTCRSRSASASC